MSATQDSVQNFKAFDLNKIYAIARAHAFPGLWLWGLAAVLCLLDAVLIFLNSRLSFTFQPMLGAIVPLAFVPVLIWRLSKVTEAESAKYVRMMRCGLMVLFLIPAMTSLGVLNHIVMAFPFPLTDEMLNRWDRALGLDWLALGRAIAYFPAVNFAMDHIYQFMVPALIMTGLHAIIAGRSDYATEFLGLVITTAIFCVSLAMFFPCIGAMDHLADPAFKAMFSKDTGNSFVPQLLELRSMALVEINPLQMAGLAAFPSFHCVCGVLIIYGSRSTRLSHIIASIFGVLLIAATPTFGGHYFVDLISGAIIAISFILIGRKFQRNSIKA